MKATEIVKLINIIAEFRHTLINLKLIIVNDSMSLIHDVYYWQINRVNNDKY